jgi:hypothetical protein
LINKTGDIQMPVISTTISAYANASNLTTQKSVSNPFASDTSKQPASPNVATAASSAADVVVTLSPQAKDASKNVPLNNLAQFFAGRDNFPQSFALSNGVTNTSNLNDSSAPGGQKSFTQVASDARASMDAQYAAMKASGKSFDINKREGEDLYKLLGSLDRRSLYAVRSNEGGQFTKDEQDLAQILMSQQQGLAMGLYAGPTSKLASYVSPFSSASEGFKNGVRFLDSVSSEEKSSTKWAIERASAQIAYESAAENEHIAPEKLDSEDPIVQLITAAMKAMKHHPNSAWTTGPLTTADDLKRQPWFKGYESKLDQVSQQLQDAQPLPK